MFGIDLLQVVQQSFHVAAGTGPQLPSVNNNFHACINSTVSYAKSLVALDVKIA